MYTTKGSPECTVYTITHGYHEAKIGGLSSFFWLGGGGYCTAQVRTPDRCCTMCISGWAGDGSPPSLVIFIACLSFFPLPPGAGVHFFRSLVMA